MTETMTRRTVRPLGDRVLVRPSKADDRKGELFIPEIARDTPMEGTVIACGPNVRVPISERQEYGGTVTETLKPGDLVLYGQYAGHEVRVNDEALLMLKLDDVEGVIEDEAL